MGRIAALLALALATSGPVVDGAATKKPRLSVRVSPRVAFSPTQVFAIAELVGGDDSEEFYCPGLEWDWNDGARSAHEADCTPFEPGMKLDRLFTARHDYVAPGEYDVRVTVRRASRSVAAATARVTVRSSSGAGY